MPNPFVGKRLDISAAISAENARNIPQALLDSLFNQERLPDACVICVDHMGPEGKARLMAFKDRAGFPVHLHRNRTRLGASGSALKALGLCKGEILVWADQGDQWLPQKLRRVEEAFLANPGTGLVVSNAHLADKGWNLLGGTVWDEARFDRQALGKFVRDPLGSVLKHPICRASCMAFRAEHLRWLFPIPMGWTIEGWIGLMLCAQRPVTLINQALSMRRLDGGRQPMRFQEPFVNLDGPTRRWERRLHCWRQAVDRLECLTPQGLECEAAHKIRQFIDHYRFRSTLPEAILSRLRHMFPEMISGRYHRFSHGWQCLFQDLFLAGAAV